MTMTEYYFDIETSGKDPANDKIISIQYQKLDRYTGKLIGDIKILKEWERSEKEIIREFLNSIFNRDSVWDFVFVGENLIFDFHFLSERAKLYNFPVIDLKFLYEQPFFDIKPLLVIINNFKFTAYSSVLKETKIKNKQIPPLYEDKLYDQLIDYIIEERDIFAEAFVNLRREMPKLKETLK